MTRDILQRVIGVLNFRFVLNYGLVCISVLFVAGTSIAEQTFDEEKCIPQAIKVCMDDSEKVIDGFQKKECWKYREVFRCISKEENYCAALEENRGCTEILGECSIYSATGICNHFVKRFICGNNTTSLIDEIKLTGSEFKVLKDEKDLEACEAEIKNKYCEIAAETCLEKEETRNINGKDIYKDCWKWDRKYQCRTDTKIDECKILQENKNCTEKSKECIHEEDGRCEHYAITFECKNKSIKEVECIKNRFCVGEVCSEQKSTPNNNFGQAASYLEVLSQAAKEGESCGCNKDKDPDCHLHKIDEEKCKLFTGEAKKCRKITGEFNCCAEKGLIKKLVGCNKQEEDLYTKQQAKLCTYIGSWRGKGLERIKQQRSYCCFNSPLARIIQEQGRVQLNIGWGHTKNPDCRALTLLEIQKIDFSRIDFSELYSDLKDKAVRDFGVQNNDIKKKLESYRANPEELAKTMKGKMEKFYEKR